MHAPRLATARVLTGRHVFLILLGFFGIVFATNAAMITLALRTFPGTEVASSYRAGREYPAELAAARAQELRGWRVDVALAREADGAVAVRFEPRDARAQPVAGLEVAVRIEHPADRYRDREVALVETRGGLYTARLDGVPAGQWLVVSEARRDGARVYRSRNRAALP